MDTFDLYFQSETFPELHCATEQPSFEMAYKYAANLLRTEANTMFHSVNIFPPVGEPRTCELVTTRGTAEKAQP